MPQVSLTGDDTVQIDGIIFMSLADGNAFDVTFPNEVGMVKRGKNGNTIYAKNEMGGVANVTLRVLLGGSDDKYLNSRLAQWMASPSSFTLMTGMFVKKQGDGSGNLQSKVYNCRGGLVKRFVEAKTASEGDSDQSVAVYELTFGDCEVSIQ